MKSTALRNRLVLAALAALLGIGIALHGDTAGARLGAHEPATSLVIVPGEVDLAKFAAVDMVDALDRVAGGPAAARSR